jgi:hypothetical protein
VGKLHLSIEIFILKDFLIIQTIIFHEIVPGYEVGILAPRNCEHACTSALVDARWTDLFDPGHGCAMA